MPLPASIEAKIAKITGDAPPPAETSSSEGSGESGPNGAADTSARVETGATETNGSSSVETSPPDPDAEIRTKRLELFNEKLAKQREERKAARLAEQALAAKKQAEEDRKAAAAEREALAAGRKDFKKFFEANGMSPREAFDEMRKQALEAGTPEAQLRQMQDAWKAEMDAIKAEMAKQVDPLKEEIEQLRQEKAEALARARNHAMLADFKEAREDKAFREVRAEYGDESIFNLIRDWDQHPNSFYEAAEAYGVTLQHPGKGFSMRDAFAVVKAAYDRDHEERKQRRARLIPDESLAGQEQPAQHALTVNGTAERRNAGTTITNDLATSRASSGRRLSRKERIEALIEREDKR